MTRRVVPNIDNIGLIIQADKKLINPGKLLWIMAIVSIYSMIVPLLMIDLFLWQYQLLYFGILNIPKIDRSQYFMFDRGKLSKLKLLQKVNCVYCEYANGMVAYAKAIANQTEVYSCAIKHSSEILGHEHQVKFYPYEDFV